MNKKFWTFRYALINMTYFAVFCGIHAYASVFLLDKGFTNTQIGILLAVANILAVIAQPVVAGIIDKGSALTNRRMVMVSSLIMIIGSLLLLFLSSSFVLVFIIYSLIYLIQMTYQPMMIAMCFEYQKAGCNIQFGLSRGLGSAGFAITSAFIGRAVAKSGTNVLIYVDVVILLLALVVVFFFKKPDSSLDSQANVDSGIKADSGDVASNDDIHNNVIDFAKAYPAFALMFVSIVFLFFAHNALNDYMFQIAADLGGNEENLGYATFIAALVELPMMAVAGMLVKKFGTRKLLNFSAVFFLIKVLLLYLAKGMALLYISQVCQMFAYALLIPVGAFFVEEIMSERDKVKGQSYINCAIALGGVICNLVCGRVLDVLGVKPMLLIGIVVTAVGVAIMIFAMSRGKD